MPMRLRQVVAASFPVIHSKKADRFRAFHPNTLIYPTKLSAKKKLVANPQAAAAADRDLVT